MQENHNRIDYHSNWMEKISNVRMYINVNSVKALSRNAYNARKSSRGIKVLLQITFVYPKKGNYNRIVYKKGNRKIEPYQINNYVRHI